MPVKTSKEGEKENSQQRNTTMMVCYRAAHHDRQLYSSGVCQY